MRTLVIGDIHGAHRALLQVLDACAFDNSTDLLVILGDVADGWPDVPQCIDRLLQVKNRIVLLGNHDEWFADWIRTGYADPDWLDQGGRATVQAYDDDAGNVPAAHAEYLGEGLNYHIDEKNRCFVHAGLSLDPAEPPEFTSVDTLRWSRAFWYEAVANEIGLVEPDARVDRLSTFAEVFIGHTATHRKWPGMNPVRACNVWNLDQGAGWDGKLTIMDVDTKEYWQSDRVPALYPAVRGRT